MMSTANSRADISLITSLFRAEAHIASYTQQVLKVAAEVKNAGLSLQIIIVANDASQAERDAIAQLVSTGRDSGTVQVVPLYVERETLYASWNRGVAASTGDCIGFWNVDDVRTSEALLEGYRLISSGCELVDFPFLIERIHSWWFWRRVKIRQRAVLYASGHLSPKHCVGTFFMASAELHRRAGAFDEQFRIAGDWQWAERQVVRAARFCQGKACAGTYRFHGANLSSVGNPLERVEWNLVFLEHQAWDSLLPTEPTLMYKKWSAWDRGRTQLPLEIQERLWGKEGVERWNQWVSDRRRPWIISKGISGWRRLKRLLGRKTDLKSATLRQSRAATTDRGGR